MKPFLKNKALMFLAATASLCFPACRDKPHAKLPPPPVVEVAAVTQADVPIYHEWIGVLDGLVNAQIRAQVAGYLRKQNYREGDPIKKGDLLFEIDPRPFKAALDQAKGLLAQAEAKLGKTELDVKRYGPLVKDKAISQEEYDDAVQANLEAKAAVASATAQVETAQLNLEFTSITSPIDGIASIAKAQIGDLVGPATGELTTVSTVDPIKAQLLRSANAQVGESVAEFFPKIGLTALLGKVSPELSGFTLGSANAWGIAAEGTGPLFEGGRLVGQYRRSKAARNEAELRYRQTVLNAFREVSDALISRLRLVEIRDHQGREVTALETAVKLSTERYVAGKADYYEVLEAQQQLFPAQLNLARTQRDQLLAVVSLYKALGGGWQDETKLNQHL